MIAICLFVRAKESFNKLIYIINNFLSIEKYLLFVQSITEQYWALLSITEHYMHYRALQSITEHYRAILSITEHYGAFQSITENYKATTKRLKTIIISHS